MDQRETITRESMRMGKFTTNIDFLIGDEILNISYLRILRTI